MHNPKDKTLPISVADCCTGCAHLDYESDTASTCRKNQGTWPATFKDGKAICCEQFNKLEITVDAVVSANYEFAEMVQTYMGENGPMTDEEIIEFVQDDLMQETGMSRNDITVRVTRNGRPQRIELPQGCALEITDGQAVFIGSYDTQFPGSGAGLQALIKAHALAGIDVGSEEYHRGIIDFLQN